ncbi:reverse transcriptase domain-containing protein [Tanacetum coccineum]|uniref:Reverse transcriptase domain-containing protein n=1 Tax=Tanacetum coccineum TaxID=301880 RepID=A0ABQ5HSC9_9ASTR
MGDKHLDTQKGSLEPSVKDPIPIPRESDVISDGDCDDDYQKRFDLKVQQLWMPSIYDENNKIRECYMIRPSAITPDLPIPDSLIMEDEHLDTIPVTESANTINLSHYPKRKFKRMNLNISPILFILTMKLSLPNQKDLDVVIPIPPGIDERCFNAESDLLESLLNRDSPIDSTKIDSIFDECSLPRPPKESNFEISDATIESLSPSPILIEDSDSLMEEIYLFLASDDSIPPGIEIVDYDSEGDIHFLEELLSNNSPPLPENESFSLDHFDDPSLPRPPPKPPNVEILAFNFEPMRLLGIPKDQERPVKRIENEAKTVRGTVAVRGGRHVSTRYCSSPRCQYEAKEAEDQALDRSPKQASGKHQYPYDWFIPAMGSSWGNPATATNPSSEDLQRAITTRLWSPSCKRKQKRDQARAYRPDLTSVRRTKYLHRATKRKGAERITVDLQYLVESERKFRVLKQLTCRTWDTHENNDWRISIHDRLGNRDVHSRLGQRRSSSESPPSSDSEDSRRKRRRRVSVSSEDTSDNEDAETGHWKSKNRYREDEDMSLPWRRQKVDAFTRRISDFSEDKRRRMPANVKTYDGTGDPDDHLKIFESAATIENWPQPVWCHMFNSTLVGNARNWFSKLPRRSIDGFEELRRAFRLNFTQRKKCAKNPVELARVKQRQGESTSVYVERYKDECIHVKACPEILKISGFMNGINNPELIKRLNDRVPQTFDELMKRTRSFIQGEAAAADSRKGYSNNRSQEQSRRQSNDQSSSRNNSYRGQRGGRGNDKYTPLTMTPKEILATEGSNFPKPPPMRTPEEQRVGNGYCEYHRQKGHTTNECVQLRQLIDKLVKEGRLDHLVKNIKEGKDKQRSGGKKDAPRDKADTIYMVQSWQRKTKQKVSQKFSHGSSISFPTLAADNAVVEPLTIEINAAGHDIHRMYIDGGASADILYEHCFKRLRPEVKSQLNPATTSLTGFTGEKIWPMGGSTVTLGTLRRGVGANTSVLSTSGYSSTSSILRPAVLSNSGSSPSLKGRTPSVTCLGLLVPTPSESADLSDGESECDVPINDDSPESHFSTFDNPLFDSNDDFSSDDESLSEEEIQKDEFKYFSNPLYDLDDEIITNEKILPNQKDLDVDIPFHREIDKPCFNAKRIF